MLSIEEINHLLNLVKQNGRECTKPTRDHRKLDYYAEEVGDRLGKFTG
jgi:hypothetical protein